MMRKGIAGGALLAVMDVNGAKSWMLAAFGLLGLGAGATISPGFFLAGFSLPSQILARLFALIELVRSVADFILSPVMLHTAQVFSGGTRLSADGIQLAMGITVLITLAATVLSPLYTFSAAPRFRSPISRRG